MAEVLDGTYTTPTEPDPIAGVVVRALSVDWVAKTASVVIWYQRASFAVEREETMTLSTDEALAVVTAAFKLAPRPKIINALIALNRLPGVTAIP